MKNFGVFMIFFLFALLAVFLMNYYTYRGFILLLELPQVWINVLSFVMLFIFISNVCFIALFRYEILPIWLYIFMASLFGVSFMLFSFALVYDILYISINKIDFSINRRGFLKQILTYSSLSLLVLYIFRGFWGGFKKPKIKDVHVNIEGLNRSISLVQISDVHVGNFLDGEYLKYIVSQVNKLNPDIVAITGDLVDYNLEAIKEDLKHIKNIKAKKGVFFVAGNHEYYHGVEPILNYLQTLHVKVLRNESENLEDINLAGVYDLAAYRLNHPLKPDLQKSLSKCDKNIPTILLSHQPKIVEQFDENTEVDLVLSGHTHGGQIFPFGLLVRLAQPYLYGLYNHNKKTKIYVSSGTGFWGPPIRFLAPSEIVNFKLNQKKV